MDTSEQPKFTCVNVFVAEAIFNLKEFTSVEELNTEYVLSYEFGIRYPNENRLENFIRVVCVNKANPSAADISVKVIGQFEGDGEQLKSLSDNCFAMLMPYLRTYVSTLTGWGPMNRILLPVMNVTSTALKKQETAQIE